MASTKSILSAAFCVAVITLAFFSHEKYGASHNVILEEEVWGISNNEAPPTSVAPTGSLGAYIYSPKLASVSCLIPGSSCSRAPSLAPVVKRKGRHPDAVFIPVQDLKRLERLNKEDKQQLKELKGQLQDLKDADRRTVERTGEQLGALRRRVSDLVATNVLLRKRVRVLRKGTGLPGKPGYAGVSGRPGVSDVVGPGIPPTFPHTRACLLQRNEDEAI